MDSDIRYRHVLSALPLPAPIDVLQTLPPTPHTIRAVPEAREAVRRVLDNRDRRLIVAAGPCSIHDPDAAMAYADRLAAISEEVAGSVLLVMRAHFDRPPSAFGWSGLLVDPHLDGSCRTDEGLLIVRRIMAALAAAGMPVVVGLSEPWSVSYLADLISWACFGAVSSESHLFREVAGGLPCPVGFKVSRDGSLESAIHAVCAAARPGRTFGMTEEGRLALFATTGNTQGHVILRGGSARQNGDTAWLARAGQALDAAGLPRRVVVDCGQGSIGREAGDGQAELFRDCLARIEAGQTIIRGLFLKSNLAGGNQPLPADPEELRYGVSVTEPCLDWETTAALVREAAAVQARVMACR